MLLYKKLKMQWELVKMRERFNSKMILLLQKKKWKLDGLSKICSQQNDIIFIFVKYMHVHLYILFKNYLRQSIKIIFDLYVEFIYIFIYFYISFQINNIITFIYNLIY